LSDGNFIYPPPDVTVANKALVDAACTEMTWWAEAERARIAWGRILERPKGVKDIYPWKVGLHFVKILQTASGLGAGFCYLGFLSANPDSKKHIIPPNASITGSKIAPNSGKKKNKHMAEGSCIQMLKTYPADFNWR